MIGCPVCKILFRFRLALFHLRRWACGPDRDEYEVAALTAVRFADKVLRAMDAGDDLEALPWKKSTLEDRRELLAVRSAAVCLLRDLSLGKPAHPALIAAMLADEDVSDVLHTRGILL